MTTKTLIIFFKVTLLCTIISSLIRRIALVADLRFSLFSLVYGAVISRSQANSL